MHNRLWQLLTIGFTVVSGTLLMTNASESTGTASQVESQAVASDQPQTLTLGLKGQNQRQLAHLITQTVTPGNANYRQYLTPHQFGRRYGLATSKVQMISRYMQQHHLKAYTYPGNIVMAVTGQTQDLERMFHIQLKQTVNQPHNYQFAVGHARLPHSISQSVSLIDQLGLKLHLNHDQKLNSFESPQLLNQVQAPNIKDRSYHKFGRTYHTAALYRAGYEGQGQTIGVIGNADFNLSDVNTYLQQSGVQSNPNRIHKIYVSKTLSHDTGDQSEITMDVEQTSTVAPRAKINAYLGNDFDADYFITSYARAIGVDNVDVISSSYGAAESDLKHGPVDLGETRLLNRLLQQAAAQGISTFNASGDSGAYAFANGSKQIAVGLPAASPYITAVGGTTLPFKDVAFTSVAAFQPATDKVIALDREAPWSGTTQLAYLFGSRYIQSVTNQYVQSVLAKATTPAEKQLLEQKIAAIEQPQTQQQVTVDDLNHNFGSGGGGFSNYFDLPSYQKGISGVGSYNAKQWINFQTGLLNAHPKLIRGHHKGRNVPDIAGDADPLTGYNVYFDGKNYPYGGNGTSVITPQTAAMAAVINSAQHQRMGFWNPQLYRFAKQSNSPFTRLNQLTDNNLYYTGQPGKLYNQASGLGTVNFTKLNAAFSRAK